MSQEKRRVYAADWFMRAAAIPCSLILAGVIANEPPGSAYEFLLSFLVILAGPVVIAGGWGAALGAGILDPAVTRSEGRAALKGLAVAGASFFTYLFALSFIPTLLYPDHADDFFKLFILLMVFGTILVGWLLAAVGALAGAQLYKKVEGERVSAGRET